MARIRTPFGWVDQPEGHQMPQTPTPPIPPAPTPTPTITKAPAAPSQADRMRMLFGAKPTMAPPPPMAPPTGSPGVFPLPAPQMPTAPPQMPQPIQPIFDPGLYPDGSPITDIMGDPKDAGYYFDPGRLPEHLRKLADIDIDYGDRPDITQLPTPMPDITIDRPMDRPVGDVLPPHQKVALPYDPAGPFRPFDPDPAGDDFLGVDRPTAMPQMPQPGDPDWESLKNMAKGSYTGGGYLPLPPHLRDLFSGVGEGGYFPSPDTPGPFTTQGLSPGFGAEQSIGGTMNAVSPATPGGQIPGVQQLGSIHPSSGLSIGWDDIRPPTPPSIPTPPPFDPGQEFRDFEQRVRDYTTGAQQEGLSLEEQQIGALREFSPEVAQYMQQFGADTPSWLNEFANIGLGLDWREPTTPVKPPTTVPPTTTPATPIPFDPEDPVGSLKNYMGNYFGQSMQDMQRGFGPSPVNQRLENFFMQPSTVPQNFDEFYKVLTGQQVGQDISPFGNALNQALLGGLAGGPFGGTMASNLANQFGARFGQEGREMQGQGVLPFLQTQLQALQQTGLPGQRLLQTPGGPLDFQSLLEGSQGMLETGGGGGLIPGLQHLMDQGLPGKQQMEGLIPSQFGLGGEQQALGLAGLNAPFTSAPQTAAEQAITSAIAGGGISPEYEQAARQRILEPAQRALRGRLGGEILGGQGSMRSGLAQELLRRQEQDFLSDLAMQGQQNLLAQQQLGLGAGQQRFGQQLGQAQAQLGAGERALGMGMGAFGAYPEATLPILGLAGGLQGQLSKQALDRFNVMGGRGLEALKTFGDLGQIPTQQATTQQALMNQLLPAALGREEYTGKFAQQNIANAMNFMDAMNRYNLGRQEIPANMISRLVGQQLANQGAPGLLGPILASAITAGPSFLKLLLGGGKDETEAGGEGGLGGIVRDILDIFKPKPTGTVPVGTPPTLPGSTGDGEEETPTTRGGKIPYEPPRIPGFLPTGGGGPMITPPFNPGVRGPL